MSFHSISASISFVAFSGYDSKDILSGFKALHFRIESSKHIWYYKCNTKGCKCNKSAKVMHQKYIELLARYQVPEDVREILMNVVESRAKSFLVSMTDRLMDLRRRKGILMGEKNDVMLRFGKGIIPGDVYYVTRRNLDAQIDEIDAEINDLAEKNSNLEIDVAEAILTACKLGDLWKNGDFDLRQRIQKMVSPKGLNWDRENENYRTISENEALRVFCLFSESYKSEDKEKTGKSFDFSGLVDYNDKLSNLLDAIRALNHVAHGLQGRD